MNIQTDGQGSACGLAGLRWGLIRYSCRGSSPVNLAIFLKGIRAEVNELSESLLVIKLLFLSAVNNVVTILFVYSTSYFIAIWSMGRVTLVPNSPLNGWERDGDWIVKGLKGRRWCSALMSECGLWMLSFNLTRWDGIRLEDEVDIRLVYGWNWYRRVFCGRYSINPVSMSKIRYCSIWCHSNLCLRSSKHGGSKGSFEEEQHELSL